MNSEIFLFLLQQTHQNVQSFYINIIGEKTGRLKLVGEPHHSHAALRRGFVRACNLTFLRVGQLRSGSALNHSQQTAVVHLFKRVLNAFVEFFYAGFNGAAQSKISDYVGASRALFQLVFKVFVLRVAH